MVAYRTSQYESAFRGHTMLSVSEPATEKRWRSKLNHLTYPGHICMELLLYTLAAASSSTRRPVGTSIVHETSDAEHPYAHTHFAWWWSEAPNLHGTALFDVVVDGDRCAHTSACCTQEVVALDACCRVSSRVIILDSRRMLLASPRSWCPSADCGKSSLRRRGEPVGTARVDA